MKAVIIEEFGDEEKLLLAEVEKPRPAPQEILVEVAFAGVNPVDWKIREGWLKKMFEHQFPLILGWDISGKDVEVGASVKGFKVGDEVFAYTRKPIVKWGGYAEFIAVDAHAAAKKPAKVSLAESAALPLVTLTAWQSLVDVAHLKKGQTVLVHAGAGGVGGMAIQLAHAIGATVITTASLKNHDYVKALGAGVAIDYTKEDFVSAIKRLYPEGVDVVYDCVGGEIEKRSLALVKSGGWFVTICNHKLDPTIAREYQINVSSVFVRPDGKELSEIAQLIDEGKIRPPQVEMLPLDSVKEAHIKQKSGHTRGKIVLKVSS